MSEGASLFPSSQTAAGAAVERAQAAPYQVLARRSRPQGFAEVVGQEHVTQTLVNAIRAGRVAHAFVFSGMRGVGKTTTARILAKALNCEQGPTPDPCNQCRNCVEITEGRSLDVFEVDAASQTGIDAARELLETVKYQPAAARFRIYIIDEAHGLSKQAVDAFLKTLEEPPPHVKFILATTAAHKLPQTILSRCQRFDFRGVARQTIAHTLGEIVRREGMQADEDALGTLARESGGSMRDATSLLDQVLAFADGRVDARTVAEALGLPDERAVRDLLGAAATRRPADALDVLAKVLGQGTDPARLCEGLLERLRHLTVLAVAGPRALADLSPAEIDDLSAAGTGVPAEDLHRWFRMLLDAHVDLSRAPDPRLVLEMTVIRMATLTPLVPLDDLVLRLEALEGGGSAPQGGAPRGPGRSAPAAAPAVAQPGAARATHGPPGTPSAALRAQPRERRVDSAKADTAPAAEQGATAVTSGSPAGQDGSEAAVVAESGPDQQRWQRLVDGLQRERPSRFFRLSYSRLLALDEQRLRVAVTGREAATALLEKETRAAIEQAILRDFGRELCFEPVVSGEGVAASPGGAEPPPSLDRRAREDPVVQLSVELLDARVEAVVPRGRR